MTVKELKELLDRCPDDTNVQLSFYDENVQAYRDVKLSGRWLATQDFIELDIR